MKKSIPKNYKKYSDLIYKFWQENYRMPSFEELKNIFQVRSKDTVSRIVANLINLKYLKKDKTGKLLPLFEKIEDLVNSSQTHLKLAGTIEAGFPTHTEASDLENVNLEKWLLGDKEATFMLKVSGDSMLEAGICQGDYIIVERGKLPKIGDVVLAEVDGNWTLKFYKKDKHGIYLEPANKKFKIIRPENNLNIHAVVVALLRKYGV